MGLLAHPLWIRANQFHPKLWDWDDYPLSRYPMRADGNWMRRKSEYIFKEHRHKHLSNN